MNHTVRKVTAGPSKDGLKAALFDRKMVNTQKPTFTLEDGTSHEVTVTSVEAEDGSGESWNIKGYAVLKPRMRIRGSLPMPHRKVKIWFRTDHRHGTWLFLN